MPQYLECTQTDLLYQAYHPFAVLSRRYPKYPDKKTKKMSAVWLVFQHIGHIEGKITYSYIFVRWDKCSRKCDIINSNGERASPGRILPPGPLSFWRAGQSAVKGVTAPAPPQRREAAEAAGGLGRKPQRVQGGACRESRGQSPLAPSAEDIAFWQRRRSTSPQKGVIENEPYSIAGG